MAFQLHSTGDCGLTVLELGPESGLTLNIRTYGTRCTRSSLSQESWWRAVADQGFEALRRANPISLPNDARFFASKDIWL